MFIVSPLLAALKQAVTSASEVSAAVQFGLDPEHAAYAPLHNSKNRINVIHFFISFLQK
jgi:hypothetical protein